MLKKIVVIGPESTGKSTLCEKLADYFNTSCCPEYAREYLVTNGTAYTYDDLLIIAKGQIALEEKYSSLVDTASHISPSSTINCQHLFIDTDLYVMKVWCNFVFGKCHTWILDQIAVRRYDLYLLCNVDQPWTKDELREYPDLERRQTLYTIYKDIMLSQPVPWVDVSGNYEERWKKAVEAVQQL